MCLNTEIHAALANIRQNVVNPLAGLVAYLEQQAQGTRIHDPVNGGILWNRDRDSEFRRLATMDPANQERELALTRGLFNLGTVQVDGQPATALSYEAPLTRRQHGSEDKNAARCDIIALLAGPPRVVAVEVKIKKGRDTNVEYGLLEAWAYAWLLRRHHTTSAHDFYNEICSSAQRYDLSVGRATAGTKFRFTFALAGTRAYFAGQARPQAILDGCKSETDDHSATDQLAFL